MSTTQSTSTTSRTASSETGFFFDTWKSLGCIDQPTGQKLRDTVTDTGTLPDEEVVAGKRLDGVVTLSGPVDDGAPVCGVVALAVDHLHGTGERVQAGQNPLADTAGRGGEHRHGCGFGRRCGVGHRREHDRRAETEPEQTDPVVLALPPRQGRPDVGLLADATVPGPVVEPQTVDRVRQCLTDGPESAICSVTAGLRVWRAGNNHCPAVGAVACREQFAVVTESSVHTPMYRCKIFKFRRFVSGCMGILARTSNVIRSKISSLLDRAEDPAEQLDYSYEQMQDELQDVKQGIADLTTQKKRLEIQKRRLEENVEKHNEQARAAVEQGRDDLGRRALEKKKQKMNQIEGLEQQINSLEQKQDKLIDQKDELKKQIQEFRTRKETMKARYEAAEASTRVSEAVTGAGEEMENVSRTIQRAEEQTEEMEARSAALDELRESGDLENAISDKSQLDRELEDISTDNAVDTELETLKSEMGAETETETESADNGDTSTGADLDAELDELDAETSDGEVDTELEELKEGN